MFRAGAAWFPLGRCSETVPGRRRASTNHLSVPRHQLSQLGARNGTETLVVQPLRSYFFDVLTRDVAVGAG